MLPEKSNYGSHPGKAGGLPTVFIADRRAKERAIRTVERYEELARVTIAPHLGTMPLSKLTPSHVSAWLATIRERGSVKGGALSGRTVRHAYVLLRAALRWALRHDLVARNVAEAVDLPDAAHSQARALTNEEASVFLAAADRTRWGPFFRTALGTAARRGELLALRWSDVNFESATVTVSRSIVESSDRKQRIVEKTTKTDRIRPIPLSPLALDALRAQRRIQVEDRLRIGPAFNDSGHVFQGELGGQIAPQIATDTFRRLRTRLKIDVSLHDLRHTAATWMLAGGIDVRTVASVLGHATPSTTLNVYAHVVAGAQEAAVAAIGESGSPEAKNPRFCGSLLPFCYRPTSEVATMPKKP